MNDFYELVDNVIKNGLQEGSMENLRKKAKKSDQPVGQHLDIPYNVEYIIKRFVNASMSTDPQIRSNASNALRSFIHSFPVEVVQQNLVKFVIDLSNYKRSGNKKNQNQAFATGRILSFMSLSPLIIDSALAFNSMKEVLEDYPSLEQQILVACYLISQGKTLKLKYQTFTPKTQTSSFLYKILLHAKNPESDPIDIQEVQKIIDLEVQAYPNHSLALQYFGTFLKNYTETPSQFFTKFGNKFLDNDSEKDANIHEIYYVMVIFKSYLESVTITHQNHLQYFSKRMTAVWLEQLRVMNKKMKEIAKSITINFSDQQPELAYEILVALHQEGVYLENISMHHPLQQLYTQVEPAKYWKYIYDLCVEAESKEQNSKELQEAITQNQTDEEPRSFFNEMQFFIKTHQKKLSLDQISSTMLLLLNKFHSDGDDKEILFLIINLMGVFCEYKEKKNVKKAKDLITRHKLFKNMMKLLKKFKISELKNVEEDKLLKIRKCLVWLKKQTTHVWEEGREDCPLTEINFYVFYAALVFFALIYPDEVETLQELQPVFSDLGGLYQVKDIPQKKVKKSGKNQGEKDPKKPVHVLVDIFIGLMTKPPNFVRSSIHCLYESIIPFMDMTDLENLIAVITTPDAEFIEQI